MSRAVLFGAIGLIMVVAIVLGQTLYSVDETNYAVVRQFGEIRAVHATPGLNFKTPFVQQVTYLDKRVLTIDSAPAEYLTSDEKRIVVDQITRWKITEPEGFFLKLNTETQGASRLERLVLGSLRENIAARHYDVMISGERDAIMDRVKVAVQVQVDREGWGVKVVDVRTQRADLPTAVEQSVYARMASARKVEADRFRATGKLRSDQITSETDRLARVMEACAGRISQEVRGRGEAAAVSIFAQALQQDPEFFAFLRRLEAYRTSFSSEDRLVTSTGSNFFQLLAGVSTPLPAVAATKGPVVPLPAEIIRPLRTEDIDKLILECIPEGTGLAAPAASR